jgi:hypothetical protein
MSSAEARPFSTARRTKCAHSASLCRRSRCLTSSAKVEIILHSISERPSENLRFRATLRIWTRTIPESQMCRVCHPNAALPLQQELIVIFFLLLCSVFSFVVPFFHATGKSPRRLPFQVTHACSAGIDCAVKLCTATYVSSHIASGRQYLQVIQHASASRGASCQAHCRASGCVSSVAKGTTGWNGSDHGPAFAAETDVRCGRRYRCIHIETTLILLGVPHELVVAELEVDPACRGHRWMNWLQENVNHM